MRREAVTADGPWCAVLAQASLSSAWAARSADPARIRVWAWDTVARCHTVATQLQQRWDQPPAANRTVAETNRAPLRRTPVDEDIAKMTEHLKNNPNMSAEDMSAFFDSATVRRHAPAGVCVCVRAARARARARAAGGGGGGGGGGGRDQGPQIAQRLQWQLSRLCASFASIAAEHRVQVCTVVFAAVEERRCERGGAQAQDRRDGEGRGQCAEERIPGAAAHCHRAE